MVSNICIDFYKLYPINCMLFLLYFLPFYDLNKNLDKYRLKMQALNLSIKQDLLYR